MQCVQSILERCAHAHINVLRPYHERECRIKDGLLGAAAGVESTQRVVPLRLQSLVGRPQRAQLVLNTFDLPEELIALVRELEHVAARLGGIVRVTLRRLQLHEQVLSLVRPLMAFVISLVASSTHRSPRLIERIGQLAHVLPRLGERAHERLGALSLAPPLFVRLGEPLGSNCLHHT